MALTKIDDRGLKTPIDLLDNEKIRLGTGNDLELFHDGSHSVIQETGTGDLEICTNTRIMLQKDRSEVLAKFIPDGAVELYHDNSKKLETTSTGVLINGHLDLEDGNAVKLGSGDDLQIYHDGTNNWFWSGGGHATIHESSGSWTVRSVANENYIVATENGSVDLYYDNSKKLETTTDGIEVTGAIFASGKLDVPDNAKLMLGTGDDLQIYHDGSNTQVYNQTGSLIIADAGGTLYLQSDASIKLTDVNGNENFLVANDNGKVLLYHDNNLRFETHSDGCSLRSTNPNGSPAHWVEGGFKPWANNTYDLGDSSYRWRALHVNDGIYFEGNNTTATQLDDYEEGTWTPTVSSGMTNATYSHQRGGYVKVGRFVYFQFDLAIDGGNGDSNHLKIGGLPFTSENASSNAYGGAFMNYQNSFLDQGSDVTLHIGLNSTDVKFYKYNGDWMAGNSSDVNDLTANIIVNGVYMAGA